MFSEIYLYSIDKQSKTKQKTELIRTKNFCSKLNDCNLKKKWGKQMKKKKPRK